MKLSLLICTLEDRKEQLTELTNGLFVQIGGNGGGFYASCSDGYIMGNNAEVLWETDSGEITTGAKRQKLLERATGDYIAFIDDDDMVPDDYVVKLLKAIESKPDCCSLTGEIRFANGINRIFEHSIDYDKWELKDGVYLRYPNHLNCVRRDLALQVGFKDITVGEDRDYSDRLKPLLHVEEHIEGVIYYYNCRNNG